MKNVFTIVLISFFSIGAWAQEKAITGTVTDANDGLALPGVNVMIKGTTVGTSTDFDGLYSIKASVGQTIVFSYIGMVTQEVEVGDKETINIALESDDASLEEVVVVGYATRKEVSRTSSAVSTVSSDGLEGKAAGVSITKSKGRYAPQSGQLTAGEINDLEKWEEWLKISEKDVAKTVKDNWEFSLQEKVAVYVTDENDNPLPNAQVAIYNEQNKFIMSARTDVFGKAQVFKDINSKADTDFYRVQVTHNNQIKGKKITKRHTDLNFQLVAGKQDNSIDIMFTIDATGSMGDEIAYLKSELKNIMNRIDRSIDEKRVALTFYRDVNDEYVVRDFDFDTNIDVVQQNLAKQYAGGGGDYEEAVEVALKNSMQQSWNKNAKARMLFLLLDAPPHLNAENVATIKQQIALAANKGIKIIPVVASGADKNVEFLTRFFSIATNGTYVFLTDDSGIGNPHLKPTTNDFKVEKLNDLLVRLIQKYAGVKTDVQVASR
ncbi:carboxypeptidase-like regulatory domain-containing protein [Spongiivirga citrea]|uniref:VWA domain-containing protein n=1 Tax=Spongiivirga citrea TaxID=1481457 RepID=A0A6M0CPS7_9FLAO|nr:carboxypeptidase-like regulatory domain-containing protein [Spongiivirga citrea]NER17497.1 VWA domain-containing protein [Spongiivirga citrea]